MSLNQGELEVPLTPETKPSLDPPTKSDDYYIENDPMAIFLVENKLFKVHRHFFTQGSEVFRGMFESSSIGSDTQDGINDDRPIHLPEVTIKEFTALLDYFYQQPHARPKEPGISYYLDLLSVSHRFLFDEIFQYGVKRLERSLLEIPVLDRVVCGDKFGLHSWLFSAYKDLLERQDLSVDEARALGYDRLVRLFKAKEYLRKELRDKLDQCQSSLQGPPRCGNCSEEREECLSSLLPPPRCGNCSEEREECLSSLLPPSRSGSRSKKLGTTTREPEMTYYCPNCGRRETVVIQQRICQKTVTDLKAVVESFFRNR